MQAPARSLSNISPVIPAHPPLWRGDTRFEAVTTREIGARCPLHAILRAPPVGDAR